MKTVTNDVFTRIRGRAANVITKYGASAVFIVAGEPASQNDDGSWNEASNDSTFDGVAIQTKSDPSKLGIGAAIANLTLRAPVTILVAALKADGSAMDGIPIAGMQMVWAGTRYNVVTTLPIAPNGVPIYYVVMGDI